MAPTLADLRVLWGGRDRLLRIAEVAEPDRRWYGHEVRLEIANRIRLWRALSGQPTFDVDYWLTRLENEVQASA